MVKDIGSLSFSTFSRYNHNWDEGMNDNFIKLAATLHPAVEAVVSSLPGGANNNDSYILSGDGKLYYRAAGEWYAIAPKIGMQVYNKDTDQMLLYSPDFEWVVAFDLDDAFSPIERNLSFHAPGLIRPNSVLFHFIPTMEFTLPEDAPGSHATLETAPDGGNLVVTMGGGRTITFSDGSTEGSFNVPADFVMHPAETENQFSQPTVFTMSVGDNFGARGLSVSLRGKIRAID